MNIMVNHFKCSSQRFASETVSCEKKGMDLLVAIELWAIMILWRMAHIRRIDSFAISKHTQFRVLFTFVLKNYNCCLKPSYLITNYYWHCLCVVFLQAILSVDVVSGVGNVSARNRGGFGHGEWHSQNTMQTGERDKSILPSYYRHPAACSLIPHRFSIPQNEFKY